MLLDVKRGSLPITAVIVHVQSTTDMTTRITTFRTLDVEHWFGQEESNQLTVLPKII